MAALVLAVAIVSGGLTPPSVAAAAPVIGTHSMHAAGAVQAGITVKYPCTSATPYGSVLVKPSQWDKGLVNTGHDKANFNVYSNYASGSCDRPIASTDGSD